MKPNNEDKNSFLIESQSVSLGNKLLYKLCKEHPCDQSINAMVAKLWIIGRSYAASPERRQYSDPTSESNGNTNDKKQNKSEGTDSFFVSLAKEIINNKKYDKLVSKISSICKKKYTFCIKDDKDFLVKTIQLVFDFNAILKTSIKKTDKSVINANFKLNSGSDHENIKINDFISFSSKFMHFHLPNLVFIYDQYSNKNISKKESEKEDNIKIENNITKKDIKDAMNEVRFDKLSDNEKIYYKHAVSCYLLMKSMSDQLKVKGFDSYVTPRMVDNFLLKK